MTIQEIIQSSEISQLDTEVLLAAILQKDRSWLLAHPEYDLSTSECGQWKEYLDRRLNHEPVSYITSVQEFYGREFIVSENVLIPRPATEGLIDATVEFLSKPQTKVQEVDTDIIIESHSINPSTPVKILDIGTGSGCIAITLALEHRLRILATDISKKALAIAQKNIDRYNLGGSIELRQEEQFESIDAQTKPFLVVSNPPYIPDSDELMPDVRDYEPHEALFSGKEGLDFIEIIREKCRNNPQCVGWVMECRKHQVCSN